MWGAAQRARDIQAVQQDPHQYRKLCVSARSDCELALIAVTAWPHNYIYMSEELKARPELIRLAPNYYRSSAIVVKAYPFDDLAITLLHNQHLATR